MIRHIPLFTLLTILLFSASCEKKEAIKNLDKLSVIQYVNPFIGTNNYDGGRTQPGAMVPNGMVTINAANVFRDTLNSQDPSTGYVHENPFIYGFSHLNLNGVGCHEAGSIVIMPTSGLEKPWLSDVRKSAYAQEKASPGYYAAFLDDHSIKAEMTSTLRSGISRFTFEKGGPASLELDLAFATSHNKFGSIEYISEDEIRGYKTDGVFCGCTNGRKVYFVMKLNKKASKVTIIKNYVPIEASNAEGKVGASFDFNMQPGEQLIAKLGISHVSIANAQLNLEAVQAAFDFEQTLANAQNEWEEKLGRIQVKGENEDDKVKFYTAVYRTLLSPFVMEDVNGEYPAMNSDEILTVKNGHRYTHYSLWDTYRTLHPFLTLVYPELQEGMTSSLVEMYKESGWLPLNELRSEETYVMVGDPSLSVIADSYAKGIRKFDVEAAMDGMQKNASYNQEDPNDIRPCMEQYLSLGYIPLECDNGRYIPYSGETRTGVWGSVSSTLEYVYSDWCVAQMAGMLGKNDIRHQFMERSNYYKNLYDEETAFFRPRLADGTWMTPYNPLDGLKEGENRAHTTGKGYVEGCAWQYLFFVPHDIPGLIPLMGGEQVFTDRLQESFDKNYFDMTNEPDITFPYLFNYVKGEEWRTQLEVRKCIDKYFHTSFDGLPGNDDAGTLSAWLAFSMMGIFPDCPGSTSYQLTSPVFDEIEIELNQDFYPGEKLIISTEKSAQDDVLIDQIKYNGNPWMRFSIDHQELTKGGTLAFQLKNAE